MVLIGLLPDVYQPSITSATITIVNPLNLIADCPHTRSASSVQVFKCNVLNVTVDRKYGRTNNSTILVNAGIAQQLINGSN